MDIADEIFAAFNNCINPDAIRSTYRSLAFRYHPDTGGSTEAFKVLGRIYEGLLKGLDGQKYFYKNPAGEQKETQYKYRPDLEQEIIDQIDTLLKLRMPADVEIALLGTWIWVQGNTRPFAKQLGKDGAKMRWNPKRTAWQWSPSTAPRRRFNANASFDDLCDSYGYERFERARERELTA